MENVLEFLQLYWYWILIGIVALIILLKFIPRYKIAPPDTALIISGLLRRNYKVRNADGRFPPRNSDTGLFAAARRSLFRRLSGSTNWTCA